MNKMSEKEKNKLKLEMLEGYDLISLDVFDLDEIDEERYNAITGKKNQHITDIIDIEELQVVFGFDVTYKDKTTSQYEIVPIDIYGYKGAFRLGFIPTYCSDDRIFEKNKEQNEYEWLEKNIESWSFYINDVSEIKGSENELVDIDGSIREIEEDDDYVTFDGVNYFICDPILTDEGTPYNLTFKKEFFEEGDIIRTDWDELENDNFRGIFKRRFVHACGKYFEEEVTIERVENDTLYCKEHKMPPINTGNIPETYELNESFDGVGFCYRFIEDEYIRYDE